MAQETEPYDQSYYQEESFVEAPKAPRLLEPSYLIPRLLYRWHWILIGLVIGLAYGYISIKLATPIYKSQAVVRVVESTGSSSADDTGTDIEVKSKGAVDAVREQFNVTELREAIARDPAVNQLPGLRPPPEKKFADIFKPESEEENEETQIPYAVDELAGEINGWASINARRNSRLIDIVVLHPRPEVAQKIANKYIYHYKRRRGIGAGSKLGEQILTTKADLKEATAAISEESRKRDSYNPALEAEVAFLEAKKQAEDLRLVFKHKHPNMVRGEELLKLRKNTLIEELQNVLVNEQDSVFWEYKRDRLKDLENPQTLSLLRSQVTARASQIDDIIADQKTQRASLSEQLKELNADRDKKSDEITTEEEARLNKAVYSPNRKQLMTKGTVYGLAAGLALAFVFQFFDNKVGSVAEAEQAYGLPILSAIKKLPSEEVMAAEKEALVDLPNSFYDVHPNLAVPGWASDPVYSEMFRVLRASVSLLGDASERNVTLVSSSIPGEGKTFVAANLALAYAKQGTRTLLIDFDLRKPAQHKIFGQPRHGFQGIVDVLVGAAGLGDVIATFEGFTNLSVIFSGTRSPTPGELMEPAKLYSIIEAYAGNFDHVIIDSAPLLPVPDTRILAPLAHNFCLVVRADHTPRKATYSALELLAADGIQPSGIVLNDFTEKKLQAGKYGYGYGEYGEGHDDDDDDPVV